MFTVGIVADDAAGCFARCCEGGERLIEFRRRSWDEDRVPCIVSRIYGVGWEIHRMGG